MKKKKDEMKKEIRTVLVVNSGSSSLKYQLFDMKTETRLAKGLVERIDDQCMISQVNSA